MFNIGDKLTKENYTQGAIWCDANNATIEKQGDDYVIVAIPEKTLEEKAEEKRAERNAMLVQEVDPIVSNPLRWAELTEEEKENYSNYRKYLLDITKEADFPKIEIKTFEEWKSTSEKLKLD